MLLTFVRMFYFASELFSIPRYPNVYFHSSVMLFPLENDIDGPTLVKYPTRVKVFILIVTFFNRMSMSDYIEVNFNGILEPKKVQVQNGIYGQSRGHLCTLSLSRNGEIENVWGDNPLPNNLIFLYC